MTAAGTAHARRSAIDRADNLCVPERGRYIRARRETHDAGETKRIDSRTRP